MGQQQGQGAAAARTPERIERQLQAGRGIALVVKWSGEEPRVLPSLFLRKNCPCAECLEKRGEAIHSRPLTPPPSPAPSSGRISLRVLKSSVDEETDLSSLWLIGNYALGIKWQDNHSSGIYSWSLLRTLWEKFCHEQDSNRP